jgi:hypothetical protein
VPIYHGFVLSKQLPRDERQLIDLSAANNPPAKIQVPSFNQQDLLLSSSVSTASAFSIIFPFA